MTRGQSSRVVRIRIPIGVPRFGQRLSPADRSMARQGESRATTRNRVRSLLDARSVTRSSHFQTDFPDVVSQSCSTPDTSRVITRLGPANRAVLTAAACLSGCDLPPTLANTSTTCMPGTCSPRTSSKPWPFGLNSANCVPYSRSRGNGLAFQIPYSSASIP